MKIQKTKHFFLVFSLLLVMVFPVGVVYGSVWVNGYFRSDGTYVSGHYRSESNGLRYDNYSWSYGDGLYNDSYYSSGYTRNWYTPSYTWDTDYYYGYNFNENYLGSSFNNPYVNSYYGSLYDYSY